jgi:hypothetical protein
MWSPVAPPAIRFNTIQVNRHALGVESFVYTSWPSTNTPMTILYFFGCCQDDALQPEGDGGPATTGGLSLSVQWRLGVHCLLCCGIIWEGQIGMIEYALRKALLAAVPGGSKCRPQPVVVQARRQHNP